MKIDSIFVDEFKMGKYMPLTPKNKNKRFLGVQKIIRITLPCERALSYFTRYFENKNYTIRRNSKGKYYNVMINGSELPKDEWNEFLNYVKVCEQYESE